MQFKLNYTVNGDWKTEDKQHIFCKDILSQLGVTNINAAYTLTFLKKDPHKKGFVKVNLIMDRFGYSCWRWKIKKIKVSDISQSFFAYMTTDSFLKKMFPKGKGCLWIKFTEL